MSKPAKFFFEPVPHAEAVDFIKSKPVLAQRVFAKLLPELKARAFTISGIECFDTIANVRQMLSELPAGGDWDKQKEQIVAEISPHLVTSDDPEERAKQEYGAERRAELLLRTHGFQAYNAAAYREMDEQRDLFPFWQYQSLGDGRVRESHAALDGIVLPAGSSFWQTHFPPWEWGCRCQVIPLSEEDVADLEKADKKLPPEERRVLEGAALAKLENERILVRHADVVNKKGLPTPINVSSDAEKGKEGAFTWHPGDLRLDAKQLEQRYAHDPQTWAAFQAWARTTQIPELEQTVWQWIEGREPLAPLQLELPLAEPKADPGLVDRVRVVRKLGGTTGAELVEDPQTGQRYVRKRGANAEHLREEVEADRRYRALGVPVPEPQLFETPGGPVKFAPFIEGRTLAELRQSDPAAFAAARLKLREHFAADALLGNWDVAGLNFDNILVDSAGTPWRIDNGGALRFRAQGAPKRDAWNAFATELWTLRDAKANAQTAELFGDLSIYDIGRQIEQLDAAAVAGDVVLGERLAHLKAIGRKALDMEQDRWKAAYSDDLARHMMGLRQAGLVADLPKQLTSTPGDVRLVDENGKPFDDLRTATSTHASVPGSGYFETIANAAKTINYHHGKGDVAYNAGKVQAALAQKPALEKMLKSGDAQKIAMAQHYLAAIDSIAAAQGDQGKTIPQVTLYQLPQAKPTSSLVVRLADYLKAQGGDWQHVESWASAQSGSSRSKQSAAYKAFLFEQLEGAKPADFYLQPDPKALAAVAPAAKRESYRQSMIAHHAFIQEVLGGTDFATNDRDRRRVRILRTETTRQAVSFPVGGKGHYTRGVNESGSLFRPVFSGAKTITNVPHSRITSLYFLERHPGKGGDFLLGDDENEATYMAWGLETYHAADSYFQADPGHDSTQWEI